MKIIKISFVLSVTIIMLISGCKNEFEPFTEPEDNVLVFSILDTRLPFQYVRMQKLYQNNNEKTNLRDIELFLIENNGNTNKLKDTILNNGNYLYYYLPNYKLKRGVDYRLCVVQDSIVRLWSDAHVWNNPLTSGYMISYLDKEVMKYAAGFYFKKASADYYLFKIFIEYDADDNGKIIKGHEELPIEIKVFPNVITSTLNFEDYEKKDYEASYTTIIKNGDTTYHVRTLPTDATRNSVYFYGESMKYAMKFLRGNYDPSQITIKRGLILFYSIDKNIYENFLKIGKEQYSVRLDEPLYWTNILTPIGSGMGFFGAMSVDTIKVKVPVELITKFGYKNGQ